MKTEIVEYYKTQKQSLKLLHQLLKCNNMLEDEYLSETVKTAITTKKLIQLVEDIFDAKVSVKNRQQNTIFARKAAAYILKNYTQLSLNEIAKYIGVSDHTTVLYNVRTCNDLMITEDWYRKKVEQIEDEIKNFSIFVNKR